MARGRKRKAGRRLPCGKRPREETQREAMSTVLEARRRHFGVTASQAKDERLGTSLGRLSFTGRIGADQFAAGQLYGEIMARNRAVMGLPMDQPRSVTALLINEGIFGASPSEPVLEAIEKLKRRFEEATNALDACDREQRMSRGRRPTHPCWCRPITRTQPRRHRRRRSCRHPGGMTLSSSSSNRHGWPMARESATYRHHHYWGTP
mgnify:CR=1 FL=1